MAADPVTPGRSQPVVAPLRGQEWSVTRLPREVRQRFCEALRSGLWAADAAVVAGVSRSTADRLVVERGGVMEPRGELSRRYLRPAEREEIAILHAQQDVRARDRSADRASAHHGEPGAGRQPEPRRQLPGGHGADPGRATRTPSQTGQAHAGPAAMRTTWSRSCNPAVVAQADQSGSTGGVPRRPSHAVLPRDDLPVDLRRTGRGELRGELRRELAAHLRTRREARKPQHRPERRKGRLVDTIHISQRPPRPPTGRCPATGRAT